MKGFFALIFILITAIPISNAYTFFVGDCDDTGSINIYSTQNIEGKVYASKDRKKWFHVPGEWSDDLKFFESEDMILNDNFRYGFIIDYRGFNYSFDAYCPGYKFSCKELNLSIESCYNRGGFFYAKFKSVNDNGAYDLRYSFETKDKNYVYSPSSKSSKLKDLKILSLGDNSYLLKLKTGLDIKKFSISHDQCYKENHKYYTYVEEYCNRTICISDEECNSNQYCDKSDFLCEELDCGICEKAINHGCVARCDDKNPCTTDECINGECNFIATEGCILNNQCISHGSVEEINNISSYCSIENKWIPQKENNQSCEKEYECINACVDNICTDSIKTRGFFQRIVDFFVNLFSF